MTFHFEFSELSASVAKRLMVQSLGRFALNCQKFHKNNILSTGLALLNNLTLGKINNYNFYGSDNDYRCIVSEEQTHKERVIKSFRSHTNCLIFAHIVNTTRRKLYFDLCDMYNKGYVLLRCDTDSITLCNNVHHDGSSEMLKQYLNSSQSPFKYKLESDNISSVTNYKKRSYMLVNDNNVILKVCGLKLTLFDRFIGQYSNLKFDLSKLGRLCLDDNNSVTYPFGFVTNDDL